MLLIALVGGYLVRNWGTVTDLTSDMGITALVLVILSVISAKVVYSEQARLAYHLVDGPPLGPGPFYRVYTISDMAKYVPGGVWGVAARVNSYLRFGLSGGDAARGFGFEKGNLVVGAMFGGLICTSLGLPGGLRGVLDSSIEAGWGWRTFEVATVATLWIVATWVLGRSLLRTAFRPIHVFRVIGEHSAIVFLLGLGVWLPARATGGELDLWLAVGAFNVGRAVGLVAVFAPAGLGVREAVGLWVIRGQDLDDIAVFAFGASRVLTTVAEAVTFAIVGLLVRSGSLKLPVGLSESPSAARD